MRFNHKFWLGGPVETRSMRPNCILQILFRDLKDLVKCISATMTKKRTLQSKAMTKSHLLTIYNVKPTVLAKSFCGSLNLKKNVVPGLRCYGQKKLQNSKKSSFGAPCYRMLLNDLYYFKDANNTWRPTPKGSRLRRIEKSCRTPWQTGVDWWKESESW